jgi:cobalt/nickel transport system permease protein
MTLAFAVPPCPDSPLRHLDPRWKLAALALVLVLVAFLQSLLPAGAALAGALLLAWLGRLPRRWFLGRLALVLLFVAPFALTLPFFFPGESWWPGIRLGLLLAVKAMTLLALALVLFVSAPLPDTLKAAHSLRVPGLLVQLFGMTYRYAFLVAGELGRLRVALRARGYRNRPTRHCYRTVGHVTGTLLVRSHERGERVSQAMRCRGFDGQYRSLSDFRTRPADVVFFLLVAAGATALLVWDLVQHRTA